MDLTFESAFSTGGLVGHLSYLLLIISMMMQRISLLRILVIASALTGILYDWVWLRDPVGVFWETSLLLVNVVQLFILHGKNLAARFSEDETAFMSAKLPGLSKGETRELLDRGEWKVICKGHVITEQGKMAGALTYIAKGSVEIVVDGVKVSECGVGDFIGEMTVLTNEPATATTLAKSDCHVWRIEGEELRKLLGKNSGMRRELDASFARCYRSKIMHANELVSQGLVP